MCNFFSLCSKGDDLPLYFDWALRQKCLSGEMEYEPDSHTSIADYFGFKGEAEDKLNKYEFNPFTKKFTIDQINTRDDSDAIERFCMGLDFKTIVPGLIVKPIFHPFNQVFIKKPTQKDIENLKKWDSVRASVWDSVRGSVWDSVWDSVGDSVWDSVRASVGDSVRDSVRDSVGDSVRDSVWDSVGDSVGDSVWDSGYGQHDANWIGFYEYFRKELGLMAQTDKLQGLQKITENAGWYLPHQGICWISERHCIVMQDERKRLHNEHGPAVKYPDGWAIYAWHGVRIPSEWIENKATITPEIALKWQNLEQRRVACEIIGWEKILNELNANTINKDKDPQIGELVEVNLPDAGKERFLRVTCGTGRRFALAVPPTCKTALEASNWTYGIDTNFIKPEVRT